MSDKLMPFEFEGAQVRVVLIEGEPWWVLVDVCRVLGLSNPTEAARRLDDDEQMRIGLSFRTVNGEGAKFNDLGKGDGNNVVIVVNESGLYSLILTSRKAAAKRFKKKVTSEILPTIRKHGAYIDPAAASPNYILEQMAKMIEINNVKQSLEWDRRAAIEEQRRLKHEERVSELLDGHDPSRGPAKDHLTMLEIVTDNGVKDTKDRAKLTRALSAGMTKWCRRRGVLTKVTAERKTILYPVGVIPTWLKEEGTTKIQAHIARVSGQSVFDFAAEKKRRDPS